MGKTTAQLPEELGGLSLFDNIMENANSISYDPAIGRYIDKETVHLSPNKDIIKSNISYGAVMGTQKEQMTEIVSKTRSNRERQVKLEAKRAALLRDDGEYPLHKNKVIIDPRQACALCEKEYKLSRLLGSVTFKAVAGGGPPTPHLYPQQTSASCSLMIACACVCYAPAFSILASATALTSPASTRAWD